MKQSWIIPVQVQPSVTVSLGGFSANVWAEYDSDRDAEEFTGFFSGDMSVSGSIALGEYVSVSPMVAYTIALSDDASDAIKSSNIDGDDAFFYGGLTLTVSL